MTTDKVSDHMTKMYDEAMALADLEPAALEATIVTAMKQSFRDVIAGSSGKLFEDTGVTMPGDHVWERYAKAALSAISARSVPEAGKVVDTTRTDILREWFGGERYARDYEYLDASFGEQADRVVAYLSALASSPAPTGAEPTRVQCNCLLSSGNIRCKDCPAPQAVPAEDVAKIETALLKLSKVGFGYDLNPHDKWALKQAAAALTASEAEATSLRKALAEARERINRYADTAAEHDLVARIDALMGASE